MMASDAKFEGLKRSSNPWIKILERRNKEPEPTIQGGGEDEEEKEEELAIRQRRKGKMIMEEEEDEETASGTNEASVFVEALNMHVPVGLLPFIFDDEPKSQEGLEDITAGNREELEGQGEMPQIDKFFNVTSLLEMDTEQLANESVRIEVEYILDEAMPEEQGEGAPVEQEGEVEGGADNEEALSSPESKASNVVPSEWFNQTIRGRMGNRSKNKPPSLKRTPSDEIRFQGDAEVKAAYQKLDKRAVIINRGFAAELLTHKLISWVVKKNK